MMNNNAQSLGIGSLVQDLYTPEQYNPAEYTLMGYDPSADIYGMYGDPGMYMDPATEAYLNAGMDAGMGAGMDTTMDQGTVAGEPTNAEIEAMAAENARISAAAADPMNNYHPSMGIQGLPTGQAVGFGGYDAEGIRYDAEGNGYDVLGRQVRDSQGRATVGMTAQQFGITPEMAARGYTIADMMG